MNKMSSSEQDKEYGKDNRELIIEENTIYEVDFDCISCMEHNNRNRNADR